VNEEDGCEEIYIKSEREKLRIRRIIIFKYDFLYYKKSTVHIRCHETHIFITYKLLLVKLLLVKLTLVVLNIKWTLTQMFILKFI